MFSICVIYGLYLCPEVLQTTDEAPQSVASDLPAFWKKVLKSVRNTTLNNFVLNLLCSQWLIWLATCKLKAVQEFEVRLYFNLVCL